MDLNLCFIWTNQRIYFSFFFGDSTGKKDVRMGGVGVWELTGEDEKEETEMDSSTRLGGAVAGLQMEYMW